MQEKLENIVSFKFSECAKMPKWMKHSMHKRIIGYDEKNHSKITNVAFNDKEYEKLVLCSSFIFGDIDDEGDSTDRMDAKSSKNGNEETKKKGTDISKPINQKRRRIENNMIDKPNSNVRSLKKERETKLFACNIKKIARVGGFTITV